MIQRLLNMRPSPIKNPGTANVCTGQRAEGWKGIDINATSGPKLTTDIQVNLVGARCGIIEQFFSLKANIVPQT